jgi:hypothetical protein
MITRLKLSTIEQGLPKYRSMLAGNAAYSPYAFESIASATGTGSSNTITFSSIPSTYQSLQIRAIARNTVSSGNAISSFNIQLNNDSTLANYTTHGLYGNGTTASAYGVTSSYTSGAMALNGVAADTMAVNIIDIQDYASTTRNKTIRSLKGGDTNGGGNVELASGLYISTSAITSISFIASANSFATSTTFALYGIKGA